MKKLLILLFPIALFSCSKSNDVKPLALVSNNCNAEPAKANLTVKEKRSYIQDTFQLAYDGKGMVKSGKNIKTKSTLAAYYKDCTIDSATFGGQYFKITKADGYYPLSADLYTQNIGSTTFSKDSFIEWTYSADKKTMVSYKWTYLSTKSDTYTVNVPSVTNTDLFFVVLY